MPNMTHSKRLKILSLNMIGISLIYAFCFGSGKVGVQHVLMTEAEIIGKAIRYSDAILEAAQANGLQPALIAAVIAAESNFNARAVSCAGAKGLMQINPPTQRYLGLQHVYDPRQNILAGSRYLRELLNRFGGDLASALAAYNAGPGAVKKHNGVPPYRETRDYVKRVLASYNHYKKVFVSMPFVS
jgi:soluble lytic murein transglycosylase-like protein